jgi:ketosteroid isomerase-like protein
MLGWYTIASEEALMSVTDAEAISDVADRLFEAIEQSDIAMVEQLWNEDVIVWKVADRDRERALRVIAWFINTTTDRRYEILDRQFSLVVSCSNTSCTPTIATADRSRCGSAS